MTVENQDLEARLRSLLDKVRSVMADGERTLSDYYGLIEAWSETYQINLPEDREGYSSMGNIGYISYLIGKKLGIRTLQGLTKNYKVLPTATVSLKAQQDISDRGRIEVALQVYLEGILKNNRVYKKELNKIITKYLSEQAPQLEKYRMQIIAAELTGEFRVKYKIEEDPNPNEAYLKQIEELFDKI